MARGSMEFYSLLDDPSVRSTASASSDPNITFNHESVGTTGNTVDMVICCLSFVGCLAIIIPNVFNRRSRKLRHSLILGLATSDLVTTIVIIITTSMLIGNVNLVEHDAGCTFLGYILSTSVFTQHLWNLAIAIVTYMILVHPLSSWTLMIEKRLKWFWPTFWLIAFALDSIAFGVGGFGFRGGYCSFRTNFYFSSIFQFVPRAIVFIVILCLYTHLFFFLRRMNLFKKAGTTSCGSREKAEHQQRQSLKSDHNQINNAFSFAVAPPPQASERSSNVDAASANSESSKHTRQTRMLNELHKDDPPSDDCRTRRSSSFAEKDEGAIELTPLAASHSSNATLAPARSQSPVSPLQHADTDSDVDSILEADTPRHMQPRKDVADFGMLTPAREHLKHCTAPRGGSGLLDILAMGDDEMMRQTHTGVGAGRRGSAVQIMPGEVMVEMPTKEEFDDAVGDDWNWGMEVGGRGHHHSNRNRHHSTSGAAGVGQYTGTSSVSSDENGGVESLGSTLNRQASLLLLLYPAAYCVLFSISMARLVVDMVNPAASVRNSHDTLHSLSRWLVFAQGAIDAVIFQLVERQFRQRMKRRRRKAMGENVTDSVTMKLGRATVQQVKRGWNSVNPRSQETSLHEEKKTATTPRAQTQSAPHP